MIRHIARCINDWDNVPDNWIVLDVAEENAEMDITSDTVLHNLSISDSRFVMVVSALRLLIRAESPIDNAMYIPSVVFSLLELPPDSEVRFVFVLFYFVLNTNSMIQFFEIKYYQISLNYFALVLLLHMKRHSRLVAIFCRFSLRNKDLSMPLLNKVHYGDFFGFSRDRVGLMTRHLIRKIKMMC